MYWRRIFSIDDEQIGGEDAGCYLSLSAVVLFLVSAHFTWQEFRYAAFSRSALADVAGVEEVDVYRRWRRVPKLAVTYQFTDELTKRRNRLEPAPTASPSAPTSTDRRKSNISQEMSKIPACGSRLRAGRSSSLSRRSRLPDTPSARCTSKPTKQPTEKKVAKAKVPCRLASRSDRLLF